MPADASVKPGELTSEYQVTKTTGIVATITAVLGLIISTLPNFVVGLPEDSKAKQYAGIAVTVASAIVALLTNLGYIKSRADVKTAAIEAKGDADAATAARLDTRL